VSFGSNVSHGLALSYRKREMRVESHALLRQRHITKLESTVDAPQDLCRLDTTGRIVCSGCSLVLETIQDKRDEIVNSDAGTPT